MLLVAGLSLKNLKPRIWDVDSPYYLPDLQAVMVSYADFHRMPGRRRGAMVQGIHTYLGIPERIQVYLDNGAFYFLGRDNGTPKDKYEDFVAQARPDWYPIPQDVIPTPNMTLAEQRRCFTQTMEVNLAYQHDGYVPVIHVSRFLREYTVAVKEQQSFSIKPAIALGGIVPNLLRAPKAISYEEILESLRYVRQAFADRDIHVFGVGGTATLHLAGILGMNSVDSSGWRNRAARGIVQLPGRGDRTVANLGSWRGRELSHIEWGILAACQCPACQQFGLKGLKTTGIEGFSNRATHNLWTLQEEARQIEAHLTDGSYQTWYTHHLNNSIYLPLIQQTVNQQSRTCMEKS